MTESLRNSLSPLKGTALHQLQLVDPSVFLLLMSDVGSYHLFIPTHRRNKVTAGPKVLTHEIALALGIVTRDINCAEMQYIFSEMRYINLFLL